MCHGPVICYSRNRQDISNFNAFLGDLLRPSFKKKSLAGWFSGLKVLTAKSDHLSLTSGTHPHGGRRESNSPGCLLSALCVLWCAHTHRKHNEKRTEDAIECRELACYTADYIIMIETLGSILSVCGWRPEVDVGDALHLIFRQGLSLNLEFPILQDCLANPLQGWTLSHGYSQGLLTHSRLAASSFAEPSPQPREVFVEWMPWSTVLISLRVFSQTRSC